MVYPTLHHVVVKHSEMPSVPSVAGKGQLEEHEFFAFMRKVKEREVGRGFGGSVGNKVAK